MRELDVVGVRVEMPSNAPMVLLREVGGSRYVPIWMGANEASAIANAQEGVTVWHIDLKERTSNVNEAATHAKEDTTARQREGRNDQCRA